MEHVQIRISVKGIWRNVAFLFFVGILFFALALFVVHTMTDPRVSDFFTFWLAGRLTLQGQDVYSQSLWLAAHHDYGSTWMPNPIFPYPIPLALFLVPLGLFPLRSAFLIWTLTAEILSTVSAFLLTESLKDKAFLRIVLIFTIFLFRPVLVSLFSGQLAPFFFFILSIAVFLWEREKWFWGGIVISLLNLKPSYGALILILAGVWLFSRRQWLALSSMALAGCRREG